MSYLIGPTSNKTARALEFGRELDKAMRTRGVGRRTVAQGIGGSDTSIMYWRTGRMLPRTETADKLAEVLRWPRLAALARRLRTKRCLVDGVEFIDESGSDNRLYCSRSCSRVATKRTVGVDRRTRAAIAERRLKVHQDAIEAFCLGCEPEGRCYAASCELRPVSPLPLYEDRPALAAVVAKPHNGYRAPGQQQAITTGVWARYTPEERQARIDRAAEASKRARGLIAS